MGLFSSNRNHGNDTYAEQNNANRHGYGNTGSQFGSHANNVNNGPPSFSSYDHGDTYGDNNVSHSATGGYRTLGHDRNAGLTNQENTINATGDHGILHHDGPTRLPGYNTNITANLGHFHRNDGGALGQDANVNTDGRHGVSRHDRNVTLVDPNTDMNAHDNHTGQSLVRDYNEPSVASKAGTARRGWFNRHRNRDYDGPASSQMTTGAAVGGGWLSRNRRTGVLKLYRRSKSLFTGHQREKFDVNSGLYNRRASFGEWLAFTWLDILTMVILSAIALGVNKAGPAPNRSFSVFFQDGQVVYPQFAYPVRDEIIPLWLSAFLAVIIPISIILCMQLRIRSFWDVNNAAIGLLYSLTTAAVFQVFLKWLIGGLRPHFLTVCQPMVDNTGIEQGNGLKQIYYNRSICSGNPDSVDEALESFPSGQSTAAFAGFIFLYLYLNAKLKVFSNHHAAMWKLVVVYAPVLGATLIAGAVTIDEYNNWYDVVAGAIIGTIMAFSAYRMVYASVWDFRFNHIPLTRHTPFSYGAGEAGAGGFETAVFTHAAGWGFDEAYGGAPFDAAHNLRGSMAGFNQGVHDQNYHHNRSNPHAKTDIAAAEEEEEEQGTTGERITGHGVHSHNDGTGVSGVHTHNMNPLSDDVDAHNRQIFGRNPTSAYMNLTNADNSTTNMPVGDVGNRNSGMEAATSTRAGRFHQSSKSLERRPVGGVQGVRGVDHMV